MQQIWVHKTTHEKKDITMDDKEANRVAFVQCTGIFICFCVFVNAFEQESERDAEGQSIHFMNSICAKINIEWSQLNTI